MIPAIATEPVSLGNPNLNDFRSRIVTGERPLLSDSTPTAPRSPDAGNGRFPSEQRSDRRKQEPPAQSLPPGAMFAAAVAAGALAPVPATREELILRIGQSWSPAESELRLADRIA